MMIVLETERAAQLGMGGGTAETYSGPSFTTTSSQEGLMMSFHQYHIDYKEN